MKKIEIPAIANGAVNSRTRCPASRPWPSTSITTYSSSLISTPDDFGLCLLLLLIRALNCSATGEIYLSTRYFEQISEHPTGVTLKFRKSCRSVQGSSEASSL